MCIKFSFRLKIVNGNKELSELKIVYAQYVCCQQMTVEPKGPAWKSSKGGTHFTHMFLCMFTHHVITSVTVPFLSNHITLLLMGEIYTCSQYFLVEVF